MVKLAKCFSDNLQRFRKEAGLSQEQLGKSIGSTRQAITRYESGDSAPSFEVIEKLANELNIDPDELLFSEKTRKRLDTYGDLYLEKHEDSGGRVRARLRSIERAISEDPNARIEVINGTPYLVAMKVYEKGPAECWRELHGDQINFAKNLLKK